MLKEIIIIIISSLITTLMISPLMLEEDWSLIKTIKDKSMYITKQILYLWLFITLVVLLTVVISIILYRLF